jgi:Protein of unknown function (DUF998)
MTSRANRVGGAVSWIAAALGYLILEAMAAAVVPSYNYAHNSISALGVPAQSPLAAAMNAAFCMEGILFLIGSVLVIRGGGGRYSWLFLFLVVTNTVGNILVATVHGGSAAGGWVWLHGLGAMLAIAGGNAAIVAGSSCMTKSVDVQWYRAVSVLVAGLGFLGLAMFSLGTSVSNAGIWERVSVYSILMWQIFTAVLLLTGATGRARPKAQWE